MAVPAIRLLIPLLLAPLLVATGTASWDRGCDCEAACAQLVSDQRQEIALLQAEVRALRGSSPLAAAERRTASSEQGHSCAGNWTIASDADVEAYRGCRTVQHLVIQGSVTSLSGLGSLESAEGITILHNEQLESLSGMENLTRVGGLLRIEKNPLLTSLLGLDGLKAAGFLELQGNNKLKSVEGLHNLETLEDELDIESNPKLRSLSGLRSLQFLRNIEIYWNGKLESLTGLEGLTSVEYLDIDGNERLTSLSGLQNIRTAEAIHVDRNDRLESLNGLEGVVSVKDILEVEANNRLSSLSGLQGVRNCGIVAILSNAMLESLTGLEGLVSVGDVVDIEYNPSLSSLSGLRSLRAVQTLYVQYNDELTSLTGLENLSSIADLKITDNDKLRSLTGLEAITSLATRLTIWENYGLTSLSGLENLRTAGWIRILDNWPLKSLVGLNNLERVQQEFEIADGNLRTLDGLESLTHVGSLHITSVPDLQSLLGLRSLTYAWGGIFIGRCQVKSLQGLGSLLRAGRLVVQSPWWGRMAALGGPFTAGASVDVIHIDEAAWPRCITPHERMALVSAVRNVDDSSVPNATWQGWHDKCERPFQEAVTCTKGHPCSFPLAYEKSIFISGPTTGCGFCAGRLKSRVNNEGILDLGYQLKDEEAGYRSVCRCGDGFGPVTQLLLRGPRQSGVTVCTRGHNCELRVEGELERTDRVVLMSKCRGGNPLSGFVAKWTAENEYLLHGPTWYAAPPARYQVCWRAPCSFSADSPVCPAPEDSYFQVGEVELLGPYPRNYMLVLGEHLSVANIGLGVSDGDQIRLSRACGKADGQGMGVLDSNSSGMLFDFGRLSEDRVMAGRHQLCWCQQRDDANCDAEQDFMSESGEVQILCPIGQELILSGRCEKCRPGMQRLEPGLEPCSKCPTGQFSQGGESCEACPEGTIAKLAGRSVCVACQSWQSADEEAADCFASPEKVVMLTVFLFSVGGLCALLVFSVRRQLSVVDVSLDEGCTIITTNRSHGLSNLGRSSFPATLHHTGHPELDSPKAPYRVRVKDAARLELVTCEGASIGSRLDTSRGTLLVAFPHDLYHQRRPVPLILSFALLLVTLVALGGLVLERGMVVEAFVGALGMALLCTGVSLAVRAWPRPTPLERRLLAFKLELARKPHCRTRACAKGPGRAIAIGKLHELLEFFRDFIRDRPAYYLESNILRLLTRAKGLSYAEYVGAGRVEWFVSHFWGTAFEHFCTALQKHAEVVCGERDWTTLHYWICFCSNNQHHIANELGEGWEESSFYVTLRSGYCRGTCMVLDDKALPLTRCWCIFELLQTVNLERNNENFEGLLLCTSGGVLNTGSGSVEVAMALADKVAEMDLSEAQATSARDAQMIRKQVIEEMGSYAALNQFVGREVYKMLVSAQHNSNQRFAAVLAHLEQGIANTADSPVLTV